MSNLDYTLIRPSAKSITFGHILSCDTESYRYSDSYRNNPIERQEFACIDFYNGVNHYYFESMNDAYLFLRTQIELHHFVTVIIHNMRYDFQTMGLMQFVLSKSFFGLDLKIALTSGVYFIKFSSKNRHQTIQFLDTWNYFSQGTNSIEKMGKALGIAKLDVEDYTLNPVDWNKKLKNGMGLKRVQIDTQILYDFFQHFLSLNFVYGISTASTAFKTWKSRFLKRAISFPHSQMDDAILSYRGGRVEPYRINVKPIFLNGYDINNLYGFVMLKNPYSYKFHKEINTINFDAIENQNYNYLYNVSYAYADNDKPARLPVLVKDKKGMLTQAYRANNVWLTGNEILEMYKQSDSILFTLHKGYEYFCDYIFSDYIQYFYDMRLNANAIESGNYKLMNNGLYGKLGQHKRHAEILGLSELPEYILSIILDVENEDKQRIEINDKTYSLHGDYVTVVKELTDEQKYAPNIASEVTANARLCNFDYQKQIGFEHVNYSDTDSFFTDREWTTSKKIGGLKLEKKGKFMIYDAKDYEYIDSNGVHYRTLKGVSKKAKQFTIEQVNAYNAEHNTNYEEIYLQNRFSSALTSGHNANGVIVTQELKKIERKHRKLNYHYANDGSGDLIGLPFDSIDST